MNCPKCNKVYKNNITLKNHLKKKIPCDIIIEYKCDICLKQFRNNYDVKRHKQNKNKCKPPKIELLQNELLKLKLEAKQKQVQITNNTQNNTSNIFNNNILVTSSDDLKNYIISECYPLIDIKKMLNNDKVQQFIDVATVDKDHDDDDILQNTKHIGLVLRLIFCNIDLKKNFIFFKDFIEDQVYYKLSKSEIKKLDTGDIFYIIDTVFKELLTFDNLDTELQQFYKKYIKKYNNQDFQEFNTNEIKKFVRQIKKDLNFSINDLDDNIKLTRKKDHKKLAIKQNDFFSELEKNKSERHTKLLDEKDNKHMLKDTNRVLKQLKELYNNDQIDDDEYKCLVYSKTFYIDDLKYIKLLSYFINKLYLKNKLSNVKYENKIFYYYKNNKWEKQTLKGIYVSFVNEMIDELYSYKLLITEDSIERNSDIDKDNDYFEFKEKLDERPYEYVLKYMLINNCEINMKKNNIEQSIIKV